MNDDGLGNAQDDDEEMLVEAQDIFISSQPIELYKVLKLASMVNSGGQAKMLIADGYVGLNGEVEYQKRKKVYAEDVIEFNGEYLYIVCDIEPKEPRTVETVKPDYIKKSDSPATIEPLNKPMPKNIKGRGSINF